MRHAEDRPAPSWVLLLILASFVGTALGGGLGVIIGTFNVAEAAGEAMLPKWLRTAVLIFGIVMVVIGGCTILWTGRARMLAFFFIAALLPTAFIILLGLTQHNT